MKDKLRQIIEECLESCTEDDLKSICETLEKIGFCTDLVNREEESNDKVE